MQDTAFSIVASESLPQPEPDEADALIGQAKRGDVAAFEALMRRYERLVMNTALRLLGGNRADAEDAAQTVFLRMHRYLGRFRDGAALPQWLYRMTVNVCRDVSRRARRRREVALDPLLGLAEAADQEAEIQQAREREIVAEGLARLPEKEREAIVLRDMQGLETREVAEILGSTEATVRSQISSGRQKIREFAERYTRRRS